MGLGMGACNLLRRPWRQDARFHLSRSHPGRCQPGLIHPVDRLL